MIEKGKELIIETGIVLVDKLKDLKEPAEIGKCIRTFIEVVGTGYIINTICKNGGINYKGKLLIGTSQKNI